MRKVQLKPRTAQMPLVPLRGVVAFPGNVIHFEAGRKKTIIAINQAMEREQLVFLLAQREEADDNPGLGDLYSVGVVARVLQIMRAGKDVVHVVAEGLWRATLVSAEEEEPFFLVQVEERFSKASEGKLKNTALIRMALDSFEEYGDQANGEAEGPISSAELLQKAEQSGDPGVVADFIAANIALAPEQAQRILEMVNTYARLEALLTILEGELDIMALEGEIQEKVRAQIDKNQKEYYLREQIRVLSGELGEADSPLEEAEEYRKSVKALHLEAQTEEKLLKECDKLAKMPAGSHEATVVRGYLETCLALPWNRRSKDRIDLKAAKRILDRDHYGLQKVKERILEMLAVRKLAPDVTGQILCLVGPPGVGKTSVARSVAKAMNRKYVRVSLGGVKDESEIRGHRRTYIGSMPGRIIDAVKQAGTSNPLLLLDEIDKLSNDFHGDPSSALLEVLDAEQNHTFHDHFIDLPFDLSHTFFITTANDAGNIPGPLLDRMELIHITSYTREEKFQIAKRHLLPRQLEKNGLQKTQLRMSDRGLRALIDGYTREAGVRTLERTIASLCRKAARRVVEEEGAVVRVDEKTLPSLLGPVKYKPERLSHKDEVGIVNGLAWTEVGGEILQVEIAVMEGTGKLELTGSLGDVMKESAKTAISCVRSRARQLGIDPEFYKKTDIHIHVPEGAVPKDGPSAGIALATAICSALKGAPVRGDVAMTGEITLRGRVLPIGGLREKTMAAYANGIKTVVIPEENLPNLEELDGVVRDALQFVPAEGIETVFETALRPVPAGMQGGEKPRIAFETAQVPLPTYIAQAEAEPHAGGR